MRPCLACHRLRARRGSQVVAQGDGWLCEYDGKTYPAMVRRYVMQARVCDLSGEATLSVFDDQVCTSMTKVSDPTGACFRCAWWAPCVSTMKR